MTITYTKACNILKEHGFELVAEARKADDLMGGSSTWKHADGREAGVWTELDKAHFEHVRIGARIRGLISGGSHLLRIPELKGY